MKSVYIHIPFCKSICSYCDFCKFYYKEEWVSKYLDILKIEIETYYESETIKTLYIGGGTPSSLSINMIKKLFEIIKIFKLNSEYEFTFECNVDDINKELLEILKENKVNRLSIGVQSFNEKKLAYLNRKHNKKDIINNIKLCKKMGFNNINVDFMYALPIENIGMMKKDFKNFLKLDIEHLSTYSLIIEDNTLIKNNKDKNLDEDTEYKMYSYILKKINKKGFHHYEVSNFSLPGYESKHNLTYWKNDEYFGFGLSAHGYINGIRYENTRNFNKYLNKEYRLNELIISRQEELENELILGLRMLDGINVKKINEKFDCDIFELFRIKKAIDKKLLIYENNLLRIPENKIYIMNEIINFIM